MPFVHTYPFDGRGPMLYAGTTLIARPTNPVLLRFYRSAEGYNYSNLRILAGVNPVSRMSSASESAFLAHGWWVYDPVAFPANANQVFKNYAAVIIKRVSANAWLELRWNALSHAAALAAVPTATSPPYAFELWCSHNASGTLATTRLATWDYAGTTVYANVPYDPAAQVTFLDVTLDGDVVTWGLSVPLPSGEVTGPSQSGKYVIPGALSTVVGSGVAGKPGLALYVDNPPGTLLGVPLWTHTAENPPFFTFMEAYDVDAANTTTDVPVIGDAEDTPPLIKIKGPITDPTLTFSLPAEDGSYDTVRASLSGTIVAGDELTIDLAGGGSITDSSGMNRYDMLDVGSRLPMLRPGINKVNIFAPNADETMPESLSVVWRDALK